MSNGDIVRVEIDGSVQTIRLDRPETMNALTAAMFDDVFDAIAAQLARPAHVARVA